MKPLIIYHKIDPDGVGSALIAKMALGDVEFYPTNYGEEKVPIDLCKNRPVYMLDFSYDNEYTKKIVDVSIHTVIIDHHKSAEQELADLDTYPICATYFDMNKAAIKLTWDWFFIEYAPDIVEYIQDYDIWAKKLPNTEEVNIYIQSKPLTIDAFQALFDEFSKNGTASIVEKGRSIISYKKAQINMHLQNSKIIDFMGYSVPVVNCSSKHLVSELGHVMAVGKPFSVSWHYNHQTDTFTLSFRSDNGVDVSEIAKMLGGGGHKNAAGTEIDFETFRTLILEK